MMKKFSKIAFLAISAILLFNGCKKDQTSKTTTQLPVQTTNVATVPEGMVMTPQGLMAKASVHMVENGYHLELSGNHIFKINNLTGKLKEDFGAINITAPVQAPASNSPVAPASSLTNSITRTLTTPEGPSWVTYSQYSAGNTPIGTFSTSWSVPANPSAGNGTELIYIGNGISTSGYVSGTTNLLIEPALQWGSNGVFGNSSSYYISNWCVWSTGAAYSTPVQVSAGNALQGAITLTNVQNSNYSYTSAFVGQSNILTVITGNTSNAAGVAIPVIQMPNYAFESLQAYGISNLGNYPNQSVIQMKKVTLQTGNPGFFVSPTPLGWTTAITSSAHLGEFTTIVNAVNNQTTAPGEVDFGFHAASCETFPAPASTCFGTAVTTAAPSNKCGGSVTFTFVPATAPTGITYNSSNGTISSSSTTAVGTYNITVNANNSGLITAGTETINVLAQPVVSYPAIVFHQGVGQTISPTITTGPVSSYSISPALPSGISFDPATGKITYTNAVALAPATYTVTYTNGSCSSFCSVSIAVGMPFAVKNRLNPDPTNSGNVNYGSMSISFSYVSNGINYGNAVVYSILNYPNAPNPYYFWLPPGNYNCVINPAQYPFPTNNVFQFGTTGANGTGAGATFQNINISPTSPNNDLFIDSTF